MKSIFYRIKNILFIRETFISIAALIIAVSTGIAAFTIMEKTIIVNLDGQIHVIKTFGPTVEDVLRSGNIEINKNDYISSSLNSKIYENMISSLNIRRVKYVTVEYGGVEYVIPSIRIYISELLSDNDMEIDSLDRIEGFTLFDKINDGMNLKIVKVEKKFEIENEEIPFDVSILTDKTADYGTVKIIELGEKGIIEHAYNAIYENGKLISRDKMYSRILRTSKKQHEIHGMIKTHTTSTGHTIRYTHVIDVRMTAYTASLKDTGKDVDHPEYGITFTGRRVEPGIVAVDPKVIALDTKMYVEIDGDTPDYGFSLAADTGGAIKNDLIDLYFETQAFVDRWGTKRGRVYILAADDPNLDLCPD